MYQLREFEGGRYTVHAENGMIVGSLSGAAGKWCAEIGNKVFGYFPTTDMAAKAILKARGIVGIYEQMAQVIRSTQRLKASFMDDFTVHDRRFIKQWGAATSILWIVRPFGTHLIALDMPLSAREAEAVLSAVHPLITGRPWDVYLIDAAVLQVLHIDEAQARQRIAEQPKYELVNMTVREHGCALASISLTPAIGPSDTGRKSHARVDCIREPSMQQIAVIKRIAGHAGDGYGAVASVDVFFNGKKL